MIQKNTPPFCVPGKTLLCDGLHFTDFTKFSEGTSSIPVGKFLKENEKTLPPLPEEYSSDTKIKKLRIISFPFILPIVKGFTFPEGPIEDNDIYDKFSETHELYADWIYIHNRKHVANKDFFDGEIKVPIPGESCGIFSHSTELPLKVLFKSKYDPENPYIIIKAEIKKFISQNKKLNRNMIVENGRNINI